jgi:hypothetical protein
LLLGDVDEGDEADDGDDADTAWRRLGRRHEQSCWAARGVLQEAEGEDADNSVFLSSGEV